MNFIFLYQATGNIEGTKLDTPFLLILHHSEKKNIQARRATKDRSNR